MTFAEGRISVVHQNVLTDAGRKLWVDVLRPPFRNYTTRFEKVSPEELENVLKLGSVGIHNAIETFYSEQYARLHPKGCTVVRPSIWVAQLGATKQTDGANSEVYTEKGYKNGGIHYDKDEMHEEFGPHWEAIEQAGFTPHVRSTYGGTTAGAWLLLRNVPDRD
jgi:hypothetical protein